MGCGVKCLNWPTPDIRCLPCIPVGVQPIDLAVKLCEANRVISEQAGNGFPGCQCVQELQICPADCTCNTVCNCDPCHIERIDLGYFLGHAVHEIVQIKINGEPIADTSEWRIEDNCFLVCPPRGWPAQYLQAGPNGQCTWTVTVRYGTAPSPALMDLRDKYYFGLLKHCFKGTTSCDKEGLTSISTSSGTYKFAEPINVLDEVAKRYGPTPFAMARFHDPGNEDLQYRVLRVGAGSGCETTDYSSFVQEWVDQETTPVEPVLDEIVLPASMAGTKLYNQLGQPIL